ncbi:MAG: FkbM family methyltransferase [Sphingomicrobium sp.]
MQERRPKGLGKPGPLASVPSKWPRLIYDLGAANGDDSAYYLSQGFRVVAVEARPDAIADLRRRFAAEISDGRLVLVAKGIAERSGEATFLLCEDIPEWSTFDPAFARRWGQRHRPITVPTTTFRALLEEFGPATYCKIDIEGSDHLCLADPGVGDLPHYLSMEFCEAIEPLVSRLSELGYRRFKLISQLRFEHPSPTLAQAKARFRHAPNIIRWAYRHLARFASRLKPRSPCGPSGPFGEATAGPWRTAEAVVELAAMVRATDAQTDWYDLHAALGDD